MLTKRAWLAFVKWESPQFNHQPMKTLLYTPTLHHSLQNMKTINQIQAEYDAKLAELDRLIAENNAKLAANHLAMHEAIADAQSAIATAIKKLSK